MNYPSKLLSSLSIAGLLATAPLASSAADQANLDLEPCINGGVSASGLFPTQAMEEQFIKYVEWADSHDLDPNFALKSSNKGWSIEGNL